MPLRTLGASALLSVSVVALSANAGDLQLADSSEFRNRLEAALNLDHDQGGARSAMQGAVVREVTLSGLINSLRGGNLDLAIAEKFVEFAEHRHQQADAAFEPIITAGLAYNRTHSYNRTDYIGRIRDGDATDLIDADGTSSSTDANDPDSADNSSDSVSIGCVTVDGVLSDDSSDGSNSGVACDLTPSYSTAVETASSSNRFVGWPNAITGGLGVGKTFGYGGSVSLSWESSRREKNSYALDALDVPSGNVDDPFGLGSRFPWTSSLSLSVSTPLPFTKDFGKYGSDANLQIDVTRSQRQRSLAERRVTRKAALQNMLLTYWDLVGAHQELGTIAEHRKVFDEIATRAKRQFELGQITAYDFNQIETERELLRDREEIAWNSYVMVCNSVRELLGSDERQLFIPTDIEREMASPVEYNSDGVFDRALKDSAEIMAVREDLFINTVAVRHQVNQTLPDLKLVMSVGVSQSDETIGYKTWRDSAVHIFDPDQLDASIFIRFTLPFGDPFGKALSRVRARESQALYELHRTRVSIVQEADSALRELESARSLIDISTEDVRLAELAYEKARNLSDKSHLSRFEFLSSYDDLLTARLANLTAKINLRKTHVNLMAAEGALDRQYFKGEKS